MLCLSQFSSWQKEMLWGQRRSPESPFRMLQATRRQRNVNQKKMQGLSSKNMAEAPYCPLGSPTCCGLARTSAPERQRGDRELC